MFNRIVFFLGKEHQLYKIIKYISKCVDEQKLLIFIFITAIRLMNVNNNKLRLGNTQLPERGFSFLPVKKYALPSKVSKIQPNDFQALRSIIVSHKQNNQMHLALIKVNDLVKQHPNIRSYQIKGEITFEMKEYQQSLVCYEKILQMTNAYENNQPFGEIIIKKDKQKRKGQALYLFNKGLCLQKLNRHNEAVTVLKQAINRDKQNIQFQLALSFSYKYVGSFDKMYKIYDKLIERDPNNFHLLIKIINNCKNQKDYKFMSLYIEKGLQNVQKLSMSNESKEAYNKLINMKADLLKITQNYKQAIQYYIKVSYETKETFEQAIIYSKIAVCYDFLKDVQKALHYYKKVLQINPDDIDTMNNMGNLQIRRKNYAASLQFFNYAILKCLINSDQNEQRLLLLKSHRIMVFVKLTMFEQASRDLSDIIKTLKQRNSCQFKNDKDRNHYNFIKDIVSKYQNSIIKINQIRHQSMNAQVQILKSQLLASISNELSQNNEEMNDDNMKKLLQKIDKMHDQIMNFKNNTLRQHEQQQNKIRCQIDKMSEIVVQKDEQANKFKQEMVLLKKEYSGIASIVQTMIQNQEKKGQFSKLVHSLKEENKQHVAMYAQQFYWIFNSYIILIKLASNNLIPLPEGQLHLNKPSSFFSKFKSVFSTLSHLPYMGIICDSINALLTFYLNLESNTIYKTLNTIITNHFCTEQQIQNSIERALIELMKSQYIEDALNRNRLQKIKSEMKINHRAQEWFKKQKDKIVGKILRVQTSQNNELKIIKQLIIEDVSAILVFMVKNQAQFTHKYSKLMTNGLFQHILHKTLICGFKKDQITSLYSRQSSKQLKNQTKGEGCATCQIYSVQIAISNWKVSCNQNEVWNELIEESIQQNNIPLFMHAVNNINFRFL